MNKQELIRQVKEAGDAVINYKSENSGKQKYNVCTLEFDNDYIKSKPNKTKAVGSKVLLFCWDTDSYRLLQPERVTSIIPLSKILRNDK